MVGLQISAIKLPAQTGGPYDLTHSVIATGGGSNSSGGLFNISGTIGQGIAGRASSSVPSRFDLHGGFWFQNLAPTSALVSITGRVTTAEGIGIRSLRLTLTSADGAKRTATTSTFGFFAFDGIEAGHTYVLEIAAKKFRFSNPTRIFSLQDHLVGIDFIAEP